MANDITPKIKNVGLPFISQYNTLDYSSKEFLFGSQNFDVLVGDDQRIYFANYEGILVYDGNFWTQMPLPNKAGVYSLVKSEEGTIYAGGVNELGFLSTNIHGKLIYSSLKEKLGTKANSSFTCWINYRIGHKIFFVTRTQLFIYDIKSDKINIVDCPNATAGVFKSNDEFYSVREDGLYHLDGATFEKVRDSKLFSLALGGKTLSVDIAGKSEVLVNKSGFFDLRTDQEIMINKEVKEFLINSVPYSVNVLYGKYIAICTLQGLLITDLDGNPVQFLNDQRGLTTDLTLHTAVDHSGILWVSTNNGINKVELFSPFSLLDDRHGLKGSTNSVTLHNNEIYMAASTGLYKNDWDELSKPLRNVSFEKMNANTSWHFIKPDSSLISLTSQSPQAIKKDGFVDLLPTNKELFWTGISYDQSSDIVLGSVSGKLMHLSKTNDTWNVKNNVAVDIPEARFMVKGEGKNIWVSNRNNGLYKIVYDPNTFEVIEQKDYGQKDGLPSNVGNHVFLVNGSLHVATSEGIYKYDSVADQFIPFPEYFEFVGAEPVSRICNDNQGNIFYLSHSLVELKKLDESYVQRILPDVKITQYQAINIIAIDSSNIFMPSFNGVMHFDPTHPYRYKQPFNVLITNLKSLTKTDTTRYNGFGDSQPNLSINYPNNALRITFSAAYYRDNDKTLYKWRLKGLKDIWSDWSNERTKDYTNLPHGDYTFEVIAKNAYNIQSEPVSIKFCIKTPWYYTSWAIGIYIVLGFVFLWGLVKLNTRRLERDKRKLQAIIDERTSQLREQKEKAEKDKETISSQHDKLVDMDNLKSRFFINVSHELRTPLTIIMGIIDQSIKGKYGDLDHQLNDDLKMTYRNSNRLLKMVNDILDISKIEGGTMQLFASKSNPARSIVNILDYFSSKFYDKNISLESQVNPDIELYLDLDKFETILINLVMNAIKFTPNVGQIRISSEETQDQVKIIVTDNGSGIPPEEIPFIFDRFYQSKLSTSGEGTGIGLSLCKEFAELHKGTIEAENNPEKGVRFILTFLKGKEHLEPYQILESKENEMHLSLQEKFPVSDIIPNKNTLVEKSDSNATYHVLLVEDNPDMSNFIKGLLGETYNVSVAENGQKGLDFLKTNKPDFILTDYLMPEMNGYQMVSEIKKIDDLRFIPTIFLTARSEEQDKLKVLNLGVDDYITKPFNAEELQIRISNLLETRTARTNFINEESIDPLDIEWKEFPSKLQQKIDQYLEQNLTEEISGDDLANCTNQSERTLYRKIKVNTGLSLMQYVKEYRMRKARKLLESGDYQTVSDVAYAVGFNYLSHFTKNYKERFGKKPSEYLE